MNMHSVLDLVLALFPACKGIEVMPDVIDADTFDVTLVLYFERPFSVANVQKRCQQIAEAVRVAFLGYWSGRVGAEYAVPQLRDIGIIFSEVEFEKQTDRSQPGSQIQGRFSPN